LDYLTNTSSILFEYYDNLEKTKSTKKNQMNILDFFGSGNLQPKEKTEEIDYVGNRAKLMDQYLSYIDNDFIDNSISNDIDICNYCSSSNLNVLLHEGIMYCEECHSMEFIITDNDKPSYKEPPKEISYFSYKRINHYNEWINQIQGKETTDIPEEVFEKILLELKKQKIDNMLDVTHARVKKILKTLRMNRFYEHAPYITHRITGVPNPHLSVELEEKLRNLFKQIQVPFLKHAPSNRKNFLSYSYTLHKFLQLLGEDEYLKYFPLLRSRTKLFQQEEIFKKICKDLNWEFIPSI
jgi:hypothetical protein